ncbi:uncharacterized protein [Palaemon carinicauda]|uniref:uncharacterized protein isoform X2 n=1 Tax=Palaemon carinicauda TaxID=392227 RepID=UPI0035B60A00
MMPSGETMTLGMKGADRGGGTGDDNDGKSAVYGDEEYGEDLAQLDMLLNYVNNLSASLEFLAWENKRISTDLVPTLLNMYDALYARLNEGADVLTTIRAGEGGDDGGGTGGRRGGSGGGGGGGGGGSAKGLSNGVVDLSNVGQDENKSAKETENGAIENGVCGNNDTRLFIEEKDLGNQTNNNNNSRDKTLLKCDKCGALRRTTSSECRCISKMSISESICTLFDNIETGLDTNTTSGSLYDNFEKRPRREHIYAEPEFVIKPKDSPKSITSTSTTSSSNTNSSSSVITSSSSSLSLKTPGTPTSPPMGQDPRKFKGVYRPLSVISSSSSSSSSSNSLPRGPVESLEDNDADHSDTEETTRRRDRTIKTRREKAQRTGSGDSGVQCHSISLPAPPTLRPKYYDPNLDYMDRIVLEIVETEAIYVRDLREIIEGYLEYWRRHPESGIAHSQAEDLFSNIEQIYTFNRAFLSELEACGVDPVAVARCFVRNNSGFAIYTQYCTNYPRTVSVLTELMRGEASVRAFRERQLALSHTLPLGSYLLKPVQRILKYHLLLGNIVKHFEKDCSGYSEIWNALSAMTGMAHHINDMKRKHEHAVRVQEIQSLLYGWQFEDLTTYGELAAEGTFRMCGAKGVRHIFLFEKMILIAKKKEENTLMYKAHILCSNLMLIESVPGEPLSFHIIPFDNPRMQYTLEARNLEQKREWTLQLKRVILENYSANIPAHARQLVMELGQSKPEDLLMSESRSSGRRAAHHAPEYLERRKAHDRRRASEGGLNTRLRLRRSSRTRKEKEEKESRSRSASRTRETEDEEMDRKISTNSAPSSSEKSKLKIPSMWGRRRSEPGIGSRESLSVTLSAPEDINTPSPDTTIDISMNTQNEAITPEISVDGLSASEYEREEEPSREFDAENGENLEEIVSKILQRELQLQKLLLNKQRRNLVRKIPFKYDTSDTENEDSPCCRNNESYLGSDNRSTRRNDDVGDYVDFYFNEGQCTTLNESANASSSECQSLYSSAVSVHNQITGDFRPLNSEKPNKPVRRSSSDLSFKKAPTGKKNTNYDNLINIWSTLRGKSPEKKHGSVTPQPKHSETSSLEKPRLRRAQSFSIDKCLNSNSENIYASPAQLVPQPNTAPVQSSKKEDIWVKDENRGSPRENRERPVTIAIYNSNEVSLSALEQYLSQPRTSGLTPERFPYDTEDNFTDYSMTPHMSMDNILSIHPEHKIYKPSNNRNTLKHVFNKITSPKSNKSISEPSGSVFNYSVESELDRNIADKKASKMVYNMARQCSKTLKERIKQIRAEDGDKSPGIKSESLYSLPIYKQGSSSIGARLAGTNEPSDYAVPRIRPMDQKPKSELRPDSVLSSSSILTSSSSSSSSSSRDTKFLEGVEVSSMANVEEENEEIQESPSFESDASADSYYERSFEAIENLETEIFRDSAIYSDPEDPESPPCVNQDRSPTSPKSRSSLSRKPSSRSSKNNPASAKLRHMESNSVSKSTKIPNEENSSPKSTESNGISPQPKKVPPPVPAKPENIKSRKSRACGSLITQQLKNLEEYSKPNISEQVPSFEGMRSLEERRKDLRVQINVECDSDIHTTEGEFSNFRHSRLTKSPSLMTSPVIKNPITLSPLSTLSVNPLPVIRSSSVPPRLSPRPSLTPESAKSSSLGASSPVDSERNSPHLSGVNPSCENEEGDEPRVARGWVKHVIGKLQAESDV